MSKTKLLFILVFLTGIIPLSHSQITPNGDCSGIGTPGICNGTGVTSLGPCDIAATAGTPCVAAHSTTRRMWNGYTGNLFQIIRASDSTTKNIGFVTSGIVDQSAIDTFCASTTCNYSILYDQMHTPISGNNLPQSTTSKQSQVTYITFSNGAKLPMLATLPGEFYRNRAATVGIPVGNSSITEYMVQNTFTWSQCCGTYGDMESTVSDTGQGHMFALTLSNNLASSHPGIGNGPWPGIDWEDGVFSTNSPTTTSTLLSTFGRYNSVNSQYSLKTDAGMSGSLTLLNSATSPATAAFEGGISLGEGGDATPAPTAFFEGIIIAGATSDATDNALNANAAAFYNGVGSASQPNQIQAISIGVSNSGSFTSLVNVPQGSLIVAFAGADANNPTLDTFTDTKSNTYTLAGFQCSGFANANPCPSGYNISVFFSFNSNALSIGDVITFHRSAGSSFAATGGLFATGVLNTSNPLDVVNTAFASSGNYNVSATPSTNADFFVVLTDGSNSTNPNGWNSPIPALVPLVGNAATIRNPGTQQLTFQATAVGIWGIVIAGFKHQ